MGLVLALHSAGFVGPGFANTAEAAVLHVPADFPAIQGCINAAIPGDECVVAPGTYNELIDFIGKAITLRSSDGPEVTIIDAGPVADPGTGKSVVRCDSGEGPDTVLDGFTVTGGTGSVCTNTMCGGGMFINSASPTVTHCIFSGNTVTAEFGGGGGMYIRSSSATVTNCTFTGNSVPNNGGGIHTFSGSPTVTDCTFSGNSAGAGGGMKNGLSTTATVTNCTFTGNSATGSGGGMDNFRASTVVTNCTFTGNSVTSVPNGVSGAGGGMSNLNLGVVPSPTVTNCTFTGNSASGTGGGMASQGSDPTVTDCTFTGNAASGAGGGMENRDSDPTVTHCTFSNNTTNGSGGGMFNHVGSSPTVTDCTFSGNATNNNGAGAGLANISSDPTVTHCTFSNNVAVLGGGISNANASNSTVINCTFRGNSALSGGAIINTESSPTITGCAFSGNTAVSRGGGIRNGSTGNPTVTDCTFSGNSAGGSGGGIFSSGGFLGDSMPVLNNCVLWGNTPDQIVDDSEAVTTVSYSDVQAGWPGAGNIDADPLFVDAIGPDGLPGTADDNLRLSYGSPAIDAGSNAAVPSDLSDLDGDGDMVEPIPFDLDGNERFLDDPATEDTGDGTPPIVDMGAFESQPTCGNGILDPGEVCDDAGESATCDLDCTLPECGDGTFNASAGEACDGGGESAACNSDCTLVDCGDGMVNATAGEQCDIGADVFGDCCAPDCNFEGTGSFCGQAPTECSDQDTCDGGGNCNINDAPLGSPCGAPADMPGSCFVGDACSGGGVCLPGTIVTTCIDNDLCCNRANGCDAENDNDCEQNVPTVSTWGLLVLALMLAAAGKVRFGHRLPTKT